MLKMVRNLWKISAEVEVNGKIPLKLYQSQRSALRVAVADVPGPMVKGMISFATETNVDDGLPHTLEHLVFMGSKRYPYKGVLDIIANRCLASGTNAYTDQDHTAYTLTTVGSNGFLKVLPVYLDHLLSPTLTDSQYITEVHHINGEGQDAGVVYSEMQDHESEMETMTNYKRKELVYPPHNSYRVSTGGKLENLRTSCSNVKVNEFHKQFYHLKNMLVMVCGKIDHDQLLASIEPIEERELSKVPDNFERPFQTVFPRLSEAKSTRIVCPADDETKGVVEISWLGPEAKELYNISALLVLFDYLSNTAVAPLQRDFVQVADPFASSVSVSLSEQSVCEVVLDFSGVPTAKLEEIMPRFFNKTVVDHTSASAFDMERIGFIIDQLIKKYLTKMENNASSEIFNALIGHQLYGCDISDVEAQSRELSARLNEINTLRKLKLEPAAFWLDLFQKTFTRNCACVMGEPSEKAVDEFEKKEMNRINDQKKKLGKEGLKLCAERLSKAIHENTANKPSAEVLNALIVKELEKFNTFDISTTSNLQGEGRFANLPFTVLHHNVQSEFVDMMLLIDTQNVPVELRQFLMLWFELIFMSPAIIDGQRLNYEEVSKLSTRDLVSNSISVGINGVYDRFISLRLRVDVPGYKNLAKWAEIFLKNIIFDASRVAICARKLESAAAESKRDGSTVAAFLSCNFSYHPEANTRIYNYIALEKFHRHISREVEKNAQPVIEKLEEVRQSVLNCPINVHLVCDESKIVNDDVEMWNFLKPERSEIFLCPANHLSDWSKVGVSNAIPVGGTESSFLLQKCEYADDWTAPTVMETLLLAQYLSQCEGPLWTSVRGQGLAYDASIYAMPDRKSMTLSLYRCANISQAYEQTKKVVLDVIESGKLEESQFEAAKRSLVCDLIGAQGSLKSAAVYAILTTVRKVDFPFTLNLCARIWDAKMDEVLKVGGPKLRKLFDEKTFIRSVATNPSKIEEVRKTFPGINVLKLDSLQIKNHKF